MGGEWHRIRVGSLVEDGVLAIGDGYRMRNQELGTTGVPFVRGGDIGNGWINHATVDHIRPEFSDRIAAKLTRPWDVAFITKGTVGRVGILRPEQPPVVFAPQVAYWRSLDHERLSSRFIYYWLRGPQFQACLDADKTHGAMVADYVSISQQHNFQLLLPPIAEQRTIAHILGTLDDKIELNRRMNETLEAMARALFKSWFVDFDPVRAKAQGQTPPGMDPATAALFPCEFQDSELGEIPKGWRVGELGDVARQVRDGVKPNEVPAETPYIGLEHMPQRSIALGSWAAASDAQSQKSRFRKGQVLFGKLRPYFHKVGVAPVDGLCSTDIVVLEPIDAAYASFCLGHASSDSFVAYTNAGSDGTRMPRTSWKQMAAYDLAIPPASIADVFGSLVGPLVKRIHANLFESRTLARSRDALLPRLLSGELSVAQADQAMEATA